MIKRERKRESKRQNILKNNKNLIMNLKQLNKSVALVFVGLLSNLEAHPKDGFFVEGGFETGELQARQRERAKRLTPISNPPSLAFPNNQSNSNNSQINKPQASINKDQISSSPQIDEPQADEPQIDEPEQVVLKYPTLKNGADIKQLEKDIKAIDTSNSQELFTKDNITDPSRAFSTTAPIKITLENKEGKVSIQNFLPYDLENVNVVVKYLENGATDNSQAKEIKIATIAKLGADKEVLLDPSQFPNLKEYFEGSIDPQDFIIKAGSGADGNTERVLEAINTITTNISGHFSNEQHWSYCKNGGVSTKPNNLYPCVVEMTTEDAKNYFNTFLSIAYVIDSKEWEDMVRNAPFKFWNGWKGGIIEPQTVIDKFRTDAPNLSLRVLANTSNVRGQAKAGGSYFAVKSEFLNLGKLDLLKDNKYCDAPNELAVGNCMQKYGNAHVVLHEFAHTKGYALGNGGSHTGNMTSSLSDGFPALTIDAWIQLGAKGKLPIYFDGKGQVEVVDDVSKVKHELGENKAKRYDCDGINVNNKTECRPLEHIPSISVVAQKEQGLQHAQVSVSSRYLQLPSQDNSTTRTESSINASLSSMFSEHLSNAFIALSNQANNNDIQTSTKEQTLKAPMLGFNAMLGYQQYFNDYIGLSYYGFFNYNNANLKGVLNQVTQLGLGVGSNLLIDFYTSYTNDSVRSVFGIFGGLRGLWNNYKSNGLIKLNKNLGNIHFTTGINYRYKHSKFSIGIALPLLKQNINAKSVQDTTISEVELSETPKNMHIYFNYGWIF
ncbi:outer membrane beta-barrel protein [Helicobacter cetorum]|uniref:outer membrane beta-barrel protein n=1 Tax=Helicobacter cetorum TaxID=138563 RepID=UPI001F28523D|nr:outer membrane beta-barrel protein [Helicobacter cetorum]